MNVVEFELKKPYSQYGIDYKVGDKITIRESKIPNFVRAGLIDDPRPKTEKKESVKK